MKEFDYSIVKNYKMAAVFKPLFMFLAFVSFRVECFGRENIPKDGEFIIAANHICIVDPVLIYLKTKRPVHFMNKQENFENSFLGWAYTHFNAFPVNRGHSDKKAVKYAIELLNQGYIFGIFPEGTRSEDCVPHQAKTGVALIARKTKCNVLPVSVYSEDMAKPFTKITVRFGKPIPFEALGFSNGVKSDELRSASNLVMKEIEGLWALGHSK